MESSLLIFAALLLCCSAAVLPDGGIDATGLMHEGEPIGFSVFSDDSFGPVTIDTTIPFPIVRTNLIHSSGIGYNPVTNRFQAPYNGLYFFSASVGSLSGVSAQASIVHTSTVGDRRVVSMSTPSEGPAGDSNSIALLLQASDYVEVKLHAGSGATWSSSQILLVGFSGSMLSNPAQLPPLSSLGPPMARHEGERVGFSGVSYGSYGPVTVDTNIPFPAIQFDVGGAWNSGSSEFVAPLPDPGFYIFATSVGSDAGKYSTASIVLNHSKRVATVKTSTEGITGDSNGIVLLLVPGDIVSVRLHADGGESFSTPTEILTSFNGLKLSQ